MFNYNNYIGDHMDKPLRVLNDGVVIELGYENIRKMYSFPEHYTPKIKSILDLTDDELLWCFESAKTEHISYYISRDNVGVSMYSRREEWSEDVCFGGHLPSVRIDLRKGMMCRMDEQILNRLYSLHVSLDYEELIRTDKAIKKE